jgi:hypothetical protein
MAKRDPFGRLPDENPLAGLGALSDGTTSQAGEPVVVAANDDWAGSEPGAYVRPSEPQAEPEAKQQAATWAASATPAKPAAAYPAVDQSLAEAIRRAEAMSRGSVVRPARVVGRVVRVVVLLVVLAVFFGVAKPLIDAGKDVRDAVSGIKAPSAADQTPAPAPGSGSGSAGPEQGAAPKVPSGLSSNSMLVRGNLSRAMSRLRKSGLGRMRSMSIRPERIDAQLLTKGGSLRSVQIKFDDPKVESLATGGGGFSHVETIPFAKIDTGAPARLVRSAAGRLRKPLSQIDYVVLISFARQPTWSAFSKAGKHFLADAHGRITSSFK